MSEGAKSALTWVLLGVAISTGIFLPRFTLFFQSAARRIVGGTAPKRTWKTVLYGLITTYFALLLLAAFLLNR